MWLLGSQQASKRGRVTSPGVSAELGGGLGVDDGFNKTVSPLSAL
jgi:predicted sugar kinase